MAFHSGYIGLFGLPNAGKSTLLNGALKQKLSIVSNKPQTTRNQILGIVNTEDLQVALMDTPGIHRARGRMHSSMVQTAKDLIPDMDAVCWVVDASNLQKRGKVHSKKSIFSKGVGYMANLFRESENLIIVLNKIDLFDRKLLFPLLQMFQDELPHAKIIPISALKSDGIEHLLKLFKEVLPEMPPMFPEDVFTDATERFIVAERIREKVFILTNQEVPYGVAVEIQGFEKEETRFKIFARIWVEKDSQKGILIGKGGSKLKDIGSRARVELEEFFGRKIYLDLIVSVRDNWSNDPRRLRELGF
jgi:GTP-binding protein Era